MNELTKRLQFSFGKKIPVIYQPEVGASGLACFAMIANYYGYQVDFLTLRKRFFSSKKGGFPNLTAIAKKLLLLTREVELEAQQLKYLNTPCILHWHTDHFVVLQKVRGQSITIHDPARGVVKYKLSEVANCFVGIAIEIIPAADFTKKKDPTRLYLSDLWYSVVGIKSHLVQIFALSLAMEIFVIVSPLFMQFITDSVIITRDFSLLYMLAASFSLFAIIQAVTEYARAWIIIFLGNILNTQLTVNLAHHLFKLPLVFFEKQHIGDIMSRFGSIAAVQQKISTDFIEGVIDGFMVFAALFVMLVYSYLLTAIEFTALLIYFGVRVLFYATFKGNNQGCLLLSAEENSIFMENIRAILPVKIFCKEVRREAIWQSCYAAKLNSMAHVTKTLLIYRMFNHLVCGLENTIIIVLGATSVMNYEFSIGMLFAYLSYRYQFVNKAQGLVDKLIEYKIIGLHLGRIANIALTEPEDNAKSNRSCDEIVQGSMRVENLAFRYATKEPYIFKNLNFAIKAGEAVAIIGRSGCGKTTLMKILLSLMQPSRGEIFIGDMKLNQMSLSSYRAQTAAVMQEDALLSGSIAENICFFDPKPDYEHIYACAKIAAIHEDIMQMPMAYQSLVGDMGTALSGGQKQRVLLARSLYSKPKILFLDEATSYLDSHNENIINHHIKQLGITRVIVAHRKATIAVADRIIDLDNL